MLRACNGQQRAAVVLAAAGVVVVAVLGLDRASVLPFTWSKGYSPIAGKFRVYVL